MECRREVSLDISDSWRGLSWCNSVLVACGAMSIMGVERLEGMYAVDNVGFEKEGSVFVGTGEFVDHFRCKMAPDRMRCDL